MSFIVFTENSRGHQFATDFNTYPAAKALFDAAKDNGDTVRIYEGELLEEN